MAVSDTISVIERGTPRVQPHRMTSIDEIRAMVRRGNKIAALRALRVTGASGATLAEAQESLAQILTADDLAAFAAARDARPADPWVETAPGIFEPASSREVVK